MIRCCNNYRIEIFLFLEHYAEIFIVIGFRQFIAEAFGLTIISITQSDDIFAHDTFCITVTFSTTTDNTNFKLTGSACTHNIRGRHRT